MTVKLKRIKYSVTIGTSVLLLVFLGGCVESSPSPEEKPSQKTEQITPSNNLSEDAGGIQSKGEKENIEPHGLNGKVLSVTDGDTIKVQLSTGQTEKVRMILIDTPETKHPRLGVQPFGKEASNYTTKELTGKDVTLELDVEERDRYGRLLAYVWVGDS